MTIAVRVTHFFTTRRWETWRKESPWAGSKLDLKAAYRKVPVHPAYSHLLAISLCGIEFQDRALPFGLRSALTEVADGLAWAMICSGILHLAHYLDDYFLGYQHGIMTALPFSSCRPSWQTRSSSRTL